MLVVDDVELPKGQKIGGGWDWKKLGDIRERVKGFGASGWSCANELFLKEGPPRELFL